MVKVRLIIEGGGEGKRQAGSFRAGWREFFQSAGITANRPIILRGGSRNQAFQRFVSEVEKANPDELPILLVDSEGPVEPNHSVWQHLQTNDGWRPPASVSDQQAFLMVQAMEAWLLADRAALQNYFGRGFRENRLPQQTNPERVPKDDLAPALARASADCRRQYAKGPVSFAILGIVNATVVAERCRHARALIDHLRSL